MKVTELNFTENGKKYRCKDINEVFEVKKGNLIAATRSFSMAELLGMEFEEIKEMKNPYTRVGDGQVYNSINESRAIAALIDKKHDYDDEMFNIVNYFNNKNYAEYIAFKETLMRRMDKFAWENNETAINWHDSCSEKYYIKFSNKHNELKIVRSYSYQSNNVYFTSREIAEKALEEFKDDLIKLYTWKFDF